MLCCVLQALQQPVNEYVGRQLVDVHILAVKSALWTLQLSLLRIHILETVCTEGMLTG